MVFIWVKVVMRVVVCIDSNICKYHQSREGEMCFSQVAQKWPLIYHLFRTYSILHSSEVLESGRMRDGVSEVSWRVNSINACSVHFLVY